MIECIDLYSGAGGLSLGLLQAGLRVKVAVDCDPDCESTYTANFPDVQFIRKDLNKIKPSEILNHVRANATIVLAGGPPCQLFSRLNRNRADNSDGIRTYVRLVRTIKPDYVVFENVPAIMKQYVAWQYLMRALKSLGYAVSFGVLKAIEFGVPQLRERTIIIAARTSIELPTGTTKTRTVRDAIGHLPAEPNGLPNHSGLRLSSINLKRIRKLRPGCNSRDRNVSFADSYARMSWDNPAPTITTKCISFSNGRFGHPEYNRAITVREAASLQGFPAEFEFHGSLFSCARQVGNAVPPPVARALGEAIKRHSRRTKRSMSN